MMADSQLFNHIQSPSHCLSHVLPLENHHLGLRPTGHKYSLPIRPSNVTKRSFIPNGYFVFNDPCVWHIELIFIQLLFSQTKNMLFIVNSKLIVITQTCWVVQLQYKKHRKVVSVQSFTWQYVIVTSVRFYYYTFAVYFRLTSNFCISFIQHRTIFFSSYLVLVHNLFLVLVLVLVHEYPLFFVLVHDDNTEGLWNNHLTFKQCEY